MNLRRPKDRSGRQRGAVLAEMALITPILVVLIMATAEVSRAFIDHNTLTKAMRTGVRHVAANAFRGTTGVVFISGSLATETRNLIVYGNIAGTGTPVLPGLSPASISIADIGNDNIEVTVSHGIGGLLGPVLRTFYGGNISMVHNLQATVTMKAL